MAANRRLLEEAIESGMLQQPNYLLEPHTSTCAGWISVGIPACSTPLRRCSANLILVYSSVFIKPARGSGRVAWHQNNNYWPSVHGTDVVTVWLAVDDADADNSALQVIPRSHTGYREYATVPHGRCGGDAAEESRGDG